MNSESNVSGEADSIGGATFWGQRHAVPTEELEPEELGRMQGRERQKDQSAALPSQLLSDSLVFCSRSPQLWHLVSRLGFLAAPWLSQTSRKLLRRPRSIAASAPRNCPPTHSPNRDTVHFTNDLLSTLSLLLEHWLNIALTAQASLYVAHDRRILVSHRFLLFSASFNFVSAKC